MKNPMISLFFAFTFSLCSYAANGPWELNKNSNGIKVYTRTIEGENIREFKAMTTIKAPRKSLVELIINVNDYANWYPDIKEAYIIKQGAANEFYTYNLLDLPWPADDRDLVSKLTIIKETNVTTINIHSVEGIKPVNPNYVRITKSYGFWKLTTEGDYTEVYFQYFASPAGNLPDWMINLFIVDNPFKTLELLKQKVGS